MRCLPAPMSVGSIHSPAPPRLRGPPGWPRFGTTATSCGSKKDSGRNMASSAGSLPIAGMRSLPVSRSTTEIRLHTSGCCGNMAVTAGRYRTAIGTAAAPSVMRHCAWRTSSCTRTQSGYTRSPFEYHTGRRRSAPTSTNKGPHPHRCGPSRAQGPAPPTAAGPRAPTLAHPFAPFNPPVSPMTANPVRITASTPCSTSTTVPNIT